MKISAALLALIFGVCWTFPWPAPPAAGEQVWAQGWDVAALKKKGGKMKKDKPPLKLGGDDSEGAMENPLHPGAPRDIQERSGLVSTGLRPLYPREADCLRIESFFADTTRYDGSSRAGEANHGYHNGFDISAPIGTPLVAIADGEVVHLFAGAQLVGNQIIVRHTPEDTGLPIWVYSKYKHFDRLPDFEIGQRVKMGQTLGPSGRTGTQGGHFGKSGYPHLHMSLFTSTEPDYKSMSQNVMPPDPKQLDPMAIYLKTSPADIDSHAARALADAEKDVPIPYMTTDGRVFPPGTRLIWPIRCAAK